MGDKVYAVICNTYWQCGDEHGDNSDLVGIYTTEDLAIKAGEFHLLSNYAYDEQSGIFYGHDYADEAWISVVEYPINESRPNGGVVIKHIPDAV